MLHRRVPALTLPEDPGPEELAQYWTLSSRDKEEIAQCRGEGQGVPVVLEQKTTILWKCLYLLVFLKDSPSLGEA